MRMEKRNRHRRLAVEKYDAVTRLASETLIAQADSESEFDAVKPGRIHSLISERAINFTIP